MNFQISLPRPHQLSICTGNAPEPQTTKMRKPRMMGPTGYWSSFFRCRWEMGETKRKKRGRGMRRESGRKENVKKNFGPTPALGSVATAKIRCVCWTMLAAQCQPLSHSMASTILCAAFRYLLTYWLRPLHCFCPLSYQSGWHFAALFNVSGVFLRRAAPSYLGRRHGCVD